MDTLQHKKFKILLIGDSCVDEYQYGVVDRISPEAPVPILKFLNKFTKPGMASNVEQNLKALECDVKFITQDPSLKIRLIDERTNHHIARIDHDVKSLPITIGQVDLAPSYDAVVISDYNKGVVTYELMENVISAFKGPVFIDTKKNDLQRLSGSFVKINSVEYSQCTSVCDDLIVTAGSKGAYYHGENFPCDTVDVSDVCGAGDTFLSALAYQYLISSDIKSAIKFANKASAVTVGKLGVYAPTLEEIV